MRISDWSSDVCSSDLMSAFGRKNGPSGIKPGFGLARPMQGGAPREEAKGGDQFPPLDMTAPPPEAPLDPLSAPPSQLQRHADALQPLSDRATADQPADARARKSVGQGKRGSVLVRLRRPRPPK